MPITQLGSRIEEVGDGGPDVATDADALLAYLPRLSRDWASEPDRRHRLIDASLLFADLSGFTAMTERLSAIGRRGAEEVSSIISEVFEMMLAPAYAAGGSLVKFGGDALFLSFEGEHHARAAAWAAAEMRRTLRSHGPIPSSVGKVRLRMTTAVASGPVHVVMAGSEQRELLLVGETVSALMSLERLASPGEILVSDETASRLRGSVTAARADGVRQLVRRPAPVPSTDIGPYAPSGSIEPYVPLAVRRRFIEDQSTPEHRRVAIGFVGVGGVDELVAADPSATAAALDDLVVSATAAAHRHEAWLLATDVTAGGAKLIVTAGAPVATGHDDVALLLTLVDILDLQTPFDLRVGANHGTVFFGDIGPSYRRTLTVMGDPVNTAARLMAAAPADAVLAARSMLATRRVRVAHRPPFSLALRGKREEMAVAEVTGLEVRADVATQAVKTLGREAELARLAEAKDAAVTGRGSVFELVGPPGSGRSRLLDEFLNRCKDLATVRLEASLGERGIPFALARRLFAAVTGLDPTDRDTGREIVSRLRQVAPALVDEVAFLARPFELEGVNDDAARAMEAPFLPGRISRAVGAVLSALGPHPLVVGIDDAHLADPASLDVLLRLCGEVARAGWLVCVTTPEQGLIPWPAGGVEQLELSDLDPATMRAIAIAITEHDPLPGHALEEIIRRSAGNPLVLREMLSARMEGVDLESIPAEAEALASARIDSLRPDRRRQLEIAAVLGSHFDPELYEMVAGPSGLDLVAGWDDGILQVSPGGRVRFANPLIAEVVYDRLPFAFRIGLHRRVADTLAEQEASGDELALHLHRGERWVEAFRAAQEAGRRAEEKYANVEAVQWYQVALDSARRSRADDGAQADLWERIGEARERLGEFTAAAEAYQNAHRLTADEEGRAMRVIRRARMLEKLGAYSKALAALTRARSKAADRFEVASAVVAYQAGIRFHQGHHATARELARRLVDAPDHPATRTYQALALMILDMAGSALGEPVDGSHSLRSLALYEDLDDLGGQARVTNNLGMFAFFDGEWEKARELYDRSRETFTRIGDEVNASYGAANVAEIWAVQGYFVEAEALFREVRRVWQAADDAYGVAYIEAQLGSIAARTGRFQEAEERFQRAMDQFGEIGARAELEEVAIGLAEAALLAGEPVRARALIDSHAAANPVRSARLSATADWQDASSRLVDSLPAALKEAREAGSLVDELWLLELADRIDPPLSLDGGDDGEKTNETRRLDLSRRLGIIASPVYPLPEAAASPRRS